MKKSAKTAEKTIGIAPLLSVGENEIKKQCEDLLQAIVSIEKEYFNTKQALKKAEADFAGMTSYVYVVTKPNGRKRCAYAEEVENPNEFLTADAFLHATEDVYKNYALVLWAVTGYSRYAQCADLQVRYAKLNGKTINNIVDVALINKDKLIEALAWWRTPERIVLVSDGLAAAKKRTHKTKYTTSSRGAAIQPYIDWETAAKAVMGMRLASTGSRRSAMQIKLGKELRPDEKAQFIRDYIAAEERIENSASDSVAREAEEICHKINDYAKMYPLFDTAKTNDIIKTLRRSGFLRISERQGAYLRRVLRDAEAYHALKTKEKIGADLLDIDDFFGFN